MVREMGILILMKDISWFNKASPYLSSFLFKLLNGSLVNAPALVDKVARGGGLARVHMADHNNVDVQFLFSHGGWSWLKWRDSLSAKVRV